MSEFEPNPCCRRPPPPPSNSDLEISAHDVAAMPDAYLIIDVRTEGEWDAARIPGSFLLPLDEIESRVDEIECPAGREIVTLCHHGVRSLKAALALRMIATADQTLSRALTRARSIAGGIEFWSLSVDRSVPRYERFAGGVRLIPRDETRSG